MRNIIQQGGIFIINPFRSSDSLLKKSISCAFNENCSAIKNSNVNYQKLLSQYNELSEKVLPIKEENKKLSKKMKEHQIKIKELMKQLNLKK